MTTLSLQTLKTMAKQFGFDDLGWTSDFTPQHKEYYLNWLKAEKHGNMSYLANNLDKRLQPQTIQDETCSILVLVTSYNHNPARDQNSKIARYAHGEDYHIWIKRNLENFASHLKSQHVPDLIWRSFVDTGPLLERDLAAKSGVGWIGKNTCLIHEELGSFVFLSVILSNLKPKFQTDVVTDQCASCRLCIDACPTQALDEYQLHASKCLAYHSIETRGERDENYWKAMGDNLVGCDICQEICPWNHKAPLTAQNNWLDGFSKYEVQDLSEWLLMSKSNYNKRFRSSAISRIRYEDMIRNVAIVALNQNNKALLMPLKNWKIKNSDLSLIEVDEAIRKLSHVE